LLACAFLLGGAVTKLFFAIFLYLKYYGNI